jgi:transcription antitermination factor NusG
VGGLARVTAGPLDGLAGKVQRVTDKRVMMLLGMFGAERVVEVRADVLEAA